MSLCHLEIAAGQVPYLDALAHQYEMVRQRQANVIPDTLLLLEHPPTITFGRKSELHDLLTPPETLNKRGITIVPIDRGGEITYHGPGQLVGYPILDLRDHGQDLHKYLRDLEEVLIQALGNWGLTGERLSGLTGVWVSGKKAAAIGIKVSRWVTMHGFALNVDPDLTPLRQDIIPCGIRDRDVTSLAELLPGDCPTLEEVKMEVADAFANVFKVSFPENTPISAPTEV